MESEPVFNPEDVEQLLDTATIGLYVLGIRALVDPDLYPSNPLTDRAVKLVEAQYGVDGGYEIPGELLSIAFPPKINMMD